MLESLTTEIGPRPAGSPAQMRARDWALAKMKALGFTNVHAEPFAKQAWLRDAESAEILAPFPQKLAILGLGNSVPTPPEGITAEWWCWRAWPSSSAARRRCVQGQDRAGQPAHDPHPGRQRLWRGGGGALRAVGSVPPGRHRLSDPFDLDQHGARAAYRRHLYAADAPRIPAGALGVPDADLLEHMAARGPVRLHLLLQSHVVNATAWTISGDVTGSTHPDQVIVVGGHIDSWDPGTGAIDDGAGVAISAAAGHLIAQLPRHPARTIRVVFWGSEETGGSGAAYLDMHKNELDKIVLAGESDLGSDNVYKLELPPGAAANPGLSPLSGILAPLKIMVATTPALDAGSDVEEIQHAGVPVLALSQDANRYFDYHHSADDTLAIVRRGELNQNVAAWAATLDMVADSDLNFRAAK